MEAKLVVIGGKANMGEVKLRLPMTIGRGNKADLMISHPTVSREHCRLFEKNGELVVQDNGSSNGTFVDGEKIVAAVVVQPGQILAIGPLTFRAEYEAPTSNVSSAKSGPLADTQAIDSDELDLDFLLGDDAPAKPAPAKPKAEKKIEAKAPAGVPSKPAKNAPPEAKDKKARGTAPTIQEPTKSTKTTADAEQAPKATSPAKGVKETAELDVDFLLDDLAEEQKQAPAAKDTSEIDLSDLGLDEPAAKSPNVAPPAAKTPAAAPKADDFEQTIDFSGIGDDDEKPAAAPMEDLLPSDDVKPGDVDFDFLSDLDDTKPAAAAKIEEPAQPAESPKIAPPPEAVAAAPVDEPAPPVPAPTAAEDLDLNDFFSTLDAPTAEAKLPIGAEPSPSKAEAAPTIAPPEAPATEQAAAEPAFDLDDFLSDVDVASSEPAAVAPQEEQSPAPAAASTPTESLEVVSPEPEAEKPEFDFSALSETQDVAIGPPAAAPAEDVSVEIAALESAAPVAEPPAEAPVEEASSPTIPDFDFLAKEEIEAVVDIGPVADSTPDVDTKPASKAADFSFLDDLEAKPAASAEITESPVAEAPVAEAAQPAAEFDFDALVVDEVRVAVEPAVVAPVAEEPNFDLASKSESPAAPEAQGPADDFDFLAAEKTESPAASAPVDETVMFSAAATPVADTPATSAEPAGEFSFDAPTTPAGEADFGALEAVEAKRESEPAAELDMFTAPTASADAAPESAPEEESAPIAFAPAAQAAPTGPVAKKPAAKGPSFLEKVKLLFGGAKKGPAKKAVAKKSGPAAPAAPTGYQPVVSHPVKPIDAPIPLDDSPISLDDLAPLETAQADAVSSVAAPSDAAPAENAATEMFVGLVSLEATAAETPSVAADVGAPEVAPELTTTEAAASFAPPASDVEATAMFDAFAADAPADEASVAPAKESAADAFDDFLSDLGASDAPTAVAETSAAAPSGEAAEAKPADEAAELDFSLDDLTPSAESEAAAEDQWSLDAPVAQSPITESPSVESPITLSPSVESAGAEPPAVDQLELDFLSEEFAASSPEAAAAAPEQPASKPVVEATQEPTLETADLFADVAGMEVPAADAASIESIAAEPPVAEAEPPAADAAPPVAEAEAPVAEVTTPPAPRRPAHIDVDLRLSSSLRPLARVHLQRPRHDVPEMEPEEPAGRCFTPRAKTPSAPVAEPETAGSESTPFDALETPTDASAPADVSAPSAEAPAFDGFHFGDDSPTSPTEVAGEPAASLGDADFDFLAKEQEAEAALDITGASPSSESPVDATADLFADLEAAVASPSVPDSPAGEQEEEFIISLDELSEEPAAEITPSEITPSTEGVSEATSVPGALGEVGAAQEAAPADAGVELDFLDLEVVDESPALVDGLEVIDVVEESPAVSTEAEKPAAQPVAAKKAPAEGDQELADFLRDLGMN